MHEEHQQTLKRRRVHPNDMIKDEKGNTGDGDCECGELSGKVHAANYTEVGAEVDDCNNNIRKSTEGDVYTQLARRESDLALAKDVGQALLAENVEVREKYGSLLELHTSQVEVLQQEKHDVKLKCERVEGLLGEKVRELTNDLENLQNKLQTLQADSRDDRRTRRENAMELIEENARFASELTKVNDSNKELQTEISRLHKMQQARSRVESFNDSEQREADALREKLVILEQEREFLDTSINELVTDKEEFGKEVNRLTKKVILLTEELADSKSELSLCEEELNSSKKENIKLQEQLDEFKLQTSQHVALNGSSIFSEISMLESECDFSMKLAESPSFKRLKKVASIQGTPKPLAASSSTNIFRQQEEQLLVDDMSDSSLEESDDGGEVVGGGSVLKQQGFFAQLEEEQRVNMELRKEMCTVCHKLLEACRRLTNDTYETKQTWEMDIDEHFLKDDAVTGTLTMIATEMVGLLKEYLESQQDESILTEENDQERLLDLEKQVEDLTTECFEAKKQLSSLGIQLVQSRKESNQKDDQMCQLIEMINNQQSEIDSLKKRSVANSNSKSQSVMEELEKAKTDVKDLDDQLLVAINQKIKLSEQLEQWQYDMASVIEDQVQKQLKNTANERDHGKRRNSRLPFMNKGWNWA